MIANRTLDAGQDLESDHPGFMDMKYRTRRAELAESAQHHNIFDPIPNIKYTKEEIETWTQVWDRMEGLWDDYACKEYKVSKGYWPFRFVVDGSFAIHFVMMYRMYTFSILLTYVCIYLASALPQTACYDTDAKSLWL